MPASSCIEMAAGALPCADLPLRSEGEQGLDLLAGIVVLDVTGSIAGPCAGQLLADLGATVVKIEKPGSGDDCRAWGPPFLDDESLWYLSANRNKHSVTLDYASRGGRPLMRALVARADVLLVNLVARVQRKLGIDHESLRAVRPGLVHVSITGFGLEGERADLPCYDLVAEGYSGVMDMTGEAGGDPQKVGTPAADLLAGEDAAMAAIAALFRRERTGEGAAIDIAMVESMTRFMAPRLVPFLGSGDLMRRSGGRDSVIAIYQTFRTADDPLTLGLGNDAIWCRFWAAVGQPEKADNPDHATNSMRRDHRDAIVADIQAVLLRRPRDEWLDLFRAARVPAGPINRLDEVARDPALRERGFLFRFERGGVAVPQVGLGIGFDGKRGGLNKAPPYLGQDNAVILGDWLGLSAAEQDDLARQGII